LEKLLGNLKGKKKINTLDKCMLDWEKDKQQEGDEEELRLAARNGSLIIFLFASMDILRSFPFVSFVVLTH